MIVGERIREEREKRGWTQGDLSKHSGTNRDTISGVESGRHRPRPSTLRKIAGAFGLEVRDLFEAADSPKALPDVEDYLRSRGAHLSALSTEEFAGELFRRREDRELRPDLREEVENIKAALELAPGDPVALAALRRARSRRQTAIIYQLTTGLLDEEKIAEIARELESDLIGGAA